MNKIDTFLSKTHCRLNCGSELEIVINFKDTPIGDLYQEDSSSAQNLEFYPLNLCLCPKCGHIQIQEVVDPDVLYGNFTYRTRVSLGLVSHFERYAAEVERKLELAKGSFILDIGSNDGSLLQFFKENNHRVLGIDPASDVANEAIEKGIPTLINYFDKTCADSVLSEYGKADLVVSNNTFANIDDLSGFFEQVKRVMKPSSTFVFETGYAIDLAKKLIIDNIYHEHLSYFLVAPLADFFERQGMVLWDVERVDTKGGSIRGFVSDQSSGKKPTQAVENLINLEKSRCLKDAEIFHELDLNVLKVKDELNLLCRKLIDDENRIVGYGASVGVTTLLNHLDIGQKLEYLVDENAIKFGCFSPGYALPVFSNQKLIEDVPEYCLITAWRYSEPIIKKNTQYLENGGCFIIPFPSPKIISIEDV